jgi:ABC-2 type transport system permease protein
VLVAVLGAVVGLVGPAVTPDAPTFAESLGATLAALPAVWLVIGLAALLAGAFPRFAPFSWGVLLVTFLVAEIGPLTDLPGWLLDVSPFTHLSTLPAGSFEPLPAVVMTVLAVVLAGAGALAYRRRDVA